MRTPRIDRLVIGIDFSDASAAATEWVATSFPDAELVLVHCLEPPRVPAFLARRLGAPERTLALAREGAHGRLAEIARALGALGARIVRTEVRECDAVEGIVASARAADASLVVVAATGIRLDGSLRGHIGRTSERLARSSPVPLLMFADGPRARPGRVVVALDDADITPRVLAWTRELSERWDARVTAVHVVSAAVMTHVLTMAAVGRASDADVTAAARDEFRADAEGWINSMVVAGLDPARVTSEIDFGEPGQEILAAAIRLDADLIVLGSRGAGAARRAFLGSVVTEVLHWSRCPVLVVVDPEDDTGAR